MQNMKYCKDCANQINEKPLPRCGASRFHDPVDGSDRRLCLIERLDGIGRCSSMANNFSPIVVAQPVAVKAKKKDKPEQEK